ncbi:ROK family glucokinase [Neobacillus cucumis]|uniref:ROK family glucokinase n=1 Tax=Neobacillus cucumis TaxID=1740721 RepID=UPI003557BA90
MSVKKGWITLYGNWLVGVDIGGTTIKMAFISQEGRIIRKWEIPTNKNENGKHIPSEIAKSINLHLNELGQSKDKLIGIGIGAPGPVNVQEGTIEVAVNLGWDNFPLRDILQQETSLPVVVENDANMAAIGEMWKGAGRGAKNLICITLGTGVGGGIIVNGKLVHGENGAGGEIGHITSLPKDGLICNCGKKGCLETIASATGIVNLAVKELACAEESSRLKEYYNKYQIVTCKQIFDSVIEADKTAMRIIDQVTFNLGFALANLANSLNPQKIVIGGGVSNAGDTLLTPLKEHFAQFTFPRVSEGVELVIATLGNDAGVIGGAWLVKDVLMNKIKGNLVPI